jgi:hypothetical protein
MTKSSLNKSSDCPFKSRSQIPKKWKVRIGRVNYKLPPSHKKVGRANLLSPVKNKKDILWFMLSKKGFTGLGIYILLAKTELLELYVRFRKADIFKVNKPV